MLNFIIALFVAKDLLTEKEGEKIAKAAFGRPIPQEYDSVVSFVDRLLKEAKLSTTRKYFDPDSFSNTAEKKEVEKTVAKKKK